MKRSQEIGSLSICFDDFKQKRMLPAITNGGLFRRFLPSVLCALAFVTLPHEGRFSFNERRKEASRGSSIFMPPVLLP